MEVLQRREGKTVRDEQAVSCAPQPGRNEKTRGECKRTWDVLPVSMHQYTAAVDTAVVVPFPPPRGAEHPSRH